MPIRTNLLLLATILVTPIRADITWPADRIVPQFEAPDGKLATINLDELSNDEQLTFASLQGLVNSGRPAIYLTRNRGREWDRWARTLELDLAEKEDPYAILKKNQDRVKGLVIYDPEKSVHYRNLAATIANVRGGLPVTREVAAKIEEAGMEFSTLGDLTELGFDNAVAIYGHLYATIWPECTKRLLLSARPTDRGGDFHHTRDMAAVCGAAVVWLDCREPEERELARKFYADMPAGEAVILGWHATERSGITTASEFGLSTLPSDHFQNSTVHAGIPVTPRLPDIPRMPELADKVYVAFIISDGDNIQYCQNAMRRAWDRWEDARGKIPLTWTIAPGLTDISPGILNYYYSSATPLDAFATGPSGMGYLMPYNTLTEPGAPVGPTLTDPARMDAFANLTERYLRRSGLRVMTIWDDATPMQREAYERHCRSLDGATVQNFRDVPAVASSIENGRLAFEKLAIPYAGNARHVDHVLSVAYNKWDRSQPLFISFQAEAWGELNPEALVKLADSLRGRMGDAIEFVRADHYFHLLAKSRSMPHDLCLEASTSIKNGAESTLVDLGGPHDLERILVENAKTGPIAIRSSEDGESWTRLPGIAAGKEGFVEITMDGKTARFIALDQAGDLRIFGAKPASSD